MPKEIRFLEEIGFLKNQHPRGPCFNLKASKVFYGPQIGLESGAKTTRYVLVSNRGPDFNLKTCAERNPISSKNRISQYAGHSY
ncbi:MAG: hypothetical protein DRR08_25060 [Candidatus Parabeggiatoa sp. nov. 2]|nr:MAG: hypothetical protein B6247_25005 [Beggiatoa sp. 4572_84]RKZ55168.1 MAG: hypothetical protein DRR08_25060 [Gammaproteobacteria bacterium]